MTACVYVLIVNHVVRSEYSALWRCVKAGGAYFFTQLVKVFVAIVYTTTTNVAVSGKTGLVAHSQVSRNGGFKYSRCCNLPMVVTTHTKFSHVLQQCITFQILQ